MTLMFQLVFPNNS